MKFIPSTVQGKIGISVALAFLIIGALFVHGINGATDGNGIIVKLFLIFLGAIIAIQVVPGMLLFTAMVKALGNLTRKEPAKERTK